MNLLFHLESINVTNAYYVIVMICEEEKDGRH